jgi:hypothetical protein
MKPHAPEAKLLIAILRDYLGTPEGLQNGFVALDRLDWDLWLALTRYNHLGPLAYWVLDRSPFRRVSKKSPSTTQPVCFTGMRRCHPFAGHWIGAAFPS